MLIGEISKKTGLSKDTIRFYEKMGLLQVNRTDSEWNTYKDYSTENLNQLLLIKKAKSFGFTLGEIAGILDLFALDSASCSELSAKVNAKIAAIDLKISDLRTMKKMISQQAMEWREACLSESGNGNCSGIKTITDG